MLSQRSLDLLVLDSGSGDEVRSVKSEVLRDGVASLQSVLGNTSLVEQLARARRVGGGGLLGQGDQLLLAVGDNSEASNLSSRDTRELVVVYVGDVTGLSRQSLRTMTLLEERVVVADALPDQGRGHCVK